MIRPSTSGSTLAIASSTAPDCQRGKRADIAEHLARYFRINVTRLEEVIAEPPHHCYPLIDSLQGRERRKAVNNCDAPCPNKSRHSAFKIADGGVDLSSAIPSSSTSP